MRNKINVIDFSLNFDIVWVGCGMTKKLLPIGSFCLENEEGVEVHIPSAETVVYGTETRETIERAEERFSNYANSQQGTSTTMAPCIKEE
jgi:hypothetical protein